MNHDEEYDDTADEYDEIYEDFDETFPDEEEEIDEEEAVPTLPGGRMAEFLKDPYPSLVLPLIIVGFIIVLLTPVDVWALWRYGIAGDYLLFVVAAAASFFAIKVWYSTSTGWLRYGGPTNLLVIWLTVGISTVDLLSWMFTGVSLFGEALLEPLVTTGIIIVLFCFYSLWLIQRTIERE
jgi:hypothetical protein